jgi:hypothetical protein
MSNQNSSVRQAENALTALYNETRDYQDRHLLKAILTRHGDVMMMTIWRENDGKHHTGKGFFEAVSYRVACNQYLYSSTIMCSGTMVAICDVSGDM